MGAGTVLVVVTTNAADTSAMEQWLAPQLPPDEVVRANGYYAAVSGLAQRPRALIVDVGVPSERDDWRLAELRARAAGAAIVVVADSTHLAALAAPLRADLALTQVRGLPPLRELLVSDEPVLDEHRARRHTRSRTTT